MVASSCFVDLLHLFPLYHRVWLLLSLTAGRRTITLQFPSISQRYLSTTLLCGWLSESNIILLHLDPFRRGFCILMKLCGSFREILLFPVFVLFCLRLLLLIFLLKRAAFIKGMFTMASATVKKFPFEEQFSPDAVGRCHEARNIPCSNFLIQKEDNAPQATIDFGTESIGLSNHFLPHTEPS